MLATITAISKNSLNTSESVSISARSPLTAGVLCRCYRTLRAWDLRSCLSGRGLKICRRPQRSL
nr:MAG TPA: hypothetical protein [Caudoviricetes sp.]